MTLRIDPARWDQYGLGRLPRSGIYTQARHNDGHRSSADVTVLDSESLRTWLCEAEGRAETLIMALLGHPPFRPVGGPTPNEPGSSSVTPTVSGDR